MEVITLTVGEMAANCYLFYDPQTLNCAIIDPGDSADLISEEILRLKLSPQFVILTHGHFDHCLACLELKLNFNLPIFLDPSDNFLYQKAFHSAKRYTSDTTLRLPPVSAPDPSLTRPFFTLIPTPGHTPGSISLYHAPFLFTGDTLFADAVGRTDLSYSCHSDLQKSLQSLSKLPPNTQIFPGHGLSIFLKQALNQ